MSPRGIRGNVRNDKLKYKKSQESFDQIKGIANGKDSRKGGHLHSDLKEGRRGAFLYRTVG